MTKPGTRVGAILSASEKVFELLGYGVYDGEQEIPCGTHGASGLEGLRNPRITLDDGRVVWGFQCWWTAEETVKAKVQHYIDHGVPVHLVDVTGVVIAIWEKDQWEYQDKGRHR